MVREFFREKAQLSGTIGGEACGPHNPLGGADVVTFSMCVLWVKTFDRLASLTTMCCVVTLLGASAWSSGTLRLVPELSVASLGLLIYFFILSLISFARGSPLVLIRPCIA
jgi:hypothetical protein